MIFFISVCAILSGGRSGGLVHVNTVIVFGYKLPGCLQSKVLPPGLEADAMPLILLSEN